jgi:hypothetical protein
MSKKNFKMAIHTVGDSHSIEGWPYGVIKHWLGPILCYSFSKEKLGRCDIRKFNLKENDVIVFCFGEIDCRCHIHKYVNENIRYEEVIDNMIDNYFEAIKLNLDLIQINIKVCVYNVVPPIQKFNTWENPEYPFLGTDDERKNYVLYFNQKLKLKCEENGFIFFDIYYNYVDGNGFLRKDMSDNNVHIKEKSHVIDFILKNRLI